MNAQALLKKYPLVSDQLDSNELLVILQELEYTLARNVPGAVIEFGCYVGTASLFIQRLLTNHGREFHVYDSFAGLPKKRRADHSPAGEQFRPGALAASKSIFIQNFKKAGLALPVIHKGWFSELSPDTVPKQIAFAFLDGDYYESILTPLKLIWPRLSPGAVIIVDDYQNEALPGAAKAVDEWLRQHRIHSLQTRASLALIHT